MTSNCELFHHDSMVMLSFIPGMHVGLLLASAPQERVEMAPGSEAVKRKQYPFLRCQDTNIYLSTYPSIHPSMVTHICS